MFMNKSHIVASGSYLPQKILTNEDLSKIVDTSDEWITSRTGIKQRHIAAENETTSQMASAAAKNAINKSGINKSDIDLIIVATTTPDKTFPSTATIVQAELGILHAAAFDVQAVCSGFLYSMSIANSMIESGNFKKALVIGADKMSSILNWEDRNTCVLFGDGAGAVILSAAVNDVDDNSDRDNKARLDSGIIDSEIASDGTLGEILYSSGGVSTTNNSGHLVMQGKEVFRHAVEKMSSAVANLMQKNNLSIDDIDWLIPHQANIRIINYMATKMSMPEEKIISTVSNHANTSAASIPLALDYACAKFKKGDTIMLSAAGAGFTWGALLLKW